MNIHRKKIFYRIERDRHLLQHISLLQSLKIFYKIERRQRRLRQYRSLLLRKIFYRIESMLMQCASGPTGSSLKIFYRIERSYQPEHLNLCLTSRRSFIELKDRLSISNTATMTSWRSFIELKAANLVYTYSCSSEKKIFYRIESQISSDLSSDHQFLEDLL